MHVRISYVFRRNPKNINPVIPGMSISNTNSKKAPIAATWLGTPYTFITKTDRFSLTPIPAIVIGNILLNWMIGRLANATLNAQM